MAKSWTVVVLLAVLLPCAAAAQPPASPELLHYYNQSAVWEPYWQWTFTLEQQVWYRYWFRYSTPSGSYTDGPHSISGGWVAPQTVPVGSTVCIEVIAENIFGSSPRSADCATIGMPPPPGPPKLDAAFGGQAIVSTTPAWSWTASPAPGFGAKHSVEFWSDVRLMGPGGVVEERSFLGFLTFKRETPLPNGSYRLEVRTRLVVPDIAPPVFSGLTTDTVIINHPVQAPELVSRFDGQEGSATPTWTWRPNFLGALPERYVVRMSWKDGGKGEEPVPGTSWQPKEPIPAGLHTIWLRAESGSARSSEVEDRIRVVPYPLKPELIECFRYAGRWITERRPTWAWHPGPDSQGILSYTVSFEKAGGTPQVQQLARDQTIWKPAADLAPGVYTFSVRAHNTAGASAAATDQVEVVLAPPQKVTLEFAAPVTAASEGAQDAKTDVRLVTTDKRPTLAKVKVLCVYEGVTATAGKDFAGPSFAVEFSAGTLNEAVMPCPIPILQDEVLESPEHFTVVLASPEGAQLGSPARHEVIVVDDEVAVPAGGKAGVEITPTSGTTTEAGGSVTFTVTLKSPSGSEVRVALASTDTSEGQVETETLVFKAGETAKTFKVTGQDDKVADRDTFYRIRTFVQSEDPLYARVDPLDPILMNQDDETLAYVAEPSGDLTIREGDSSLKLKVSLTGPPPSPLTDIPVSSSSNRATVKPDKLSFDKDSWQGRVVELTVPPNQKADPAASAVVTIGTASVNVRVLDDDPPRLLLDPEPAGEVELAEKSSKTYKVRLVDPPSGTIDLKAASSDPRVKVTLAAFSLTPSSWSSGVDLTVSAEDNTVWEADASVLVTVEAEGGSRVLRFRFKNNDETPAYVVEPSGSLTIREGDPSLNLNVSLTGPPPASLTDIPVSSSSSRVTVEPGNLSLKDGWKDRVVKLTVPPNQKADPAASAVVAIGPVSVNVRVLDDDVAGISFSPGSLRIDEPGGSKSFTVSLASKASAKVEIPLNAEPPGRVTLSENRVTFAAGTSEKEVTVTVKDDLVADGLETVKLWLDPAESSSGDYQGRTPTGAQYVEVISADDDVQGLVLVPEPSGETSLKEGESASYKLRLAREPVSPVEVSFTVSDSRAGKVESVGTKTLSSANWNQGIELKVSALADEVDGEDMPFQVVAQTEPGLPARVLRFRRTDNDPTLFVLRPAALALEEGAECPAHFSVALTGPPAGPISVPVSTGTSRLEAGPATLSFDTSNWREPREVQVSAPANRRADGDASIQVSVGEGSGIAAAKVSVGLDDDDAPGISLGTAALRIDEPGGTREVEVRLGSDPTHTVKVPLTVEAATGRVELSPAPEFTPGGPLTKKVSITVKDDPDMDGEETFRIKLGHAVSDDPLYKDRAPDGAGTVTVASANDDVQATVFDPEPSGEVALHEGQAGYKIRFGLAKRPAVPVPVSFTIKAGETTLGSGNKTFLPEKWQPGDWVEFEVGNPDDGVDNPESFLRLDVKLKDGTVIAADQVPQPRSLTFRKIDDDAAGVRFDPPLELLLPADGTPGKVRVSLASHPTKPVTVPMYSWDEGHGYRHLGDFPFDEGSWQAGREVTLPGGTQWLVADPLRSADPRYGVQSAGVVVQRPGTERAVAVFPSSGLITSEAGGSAVFFLALGSRPAEPVTVPLSVPSGEAALSAESVTFTPDDWARAREVRITGRNDGIDDGPVPYAVVTGAVQSGDPAWAGIDPPDVRALSVAGVKAAVLALPAVAESTEGRPVAAQVAVVLASRPSRDVVVLARPSEGEVFPGTLVFTPRTWNLPQTVSSRGRDDLVDDGDSTYSLRLDPAASPDPVYAALLPVQVELASRDNETAGLLEYLPTHETNEAGRASTLAVALRTAPTAPVTLRFESADPAEVEVVPATAYFGTDPMLFNQAHWITVRGVDDSGDEGDGKPVVVRVTMESTDPLYAAIDPPDLTVFNRDDDEAGFEVQPDEGVIAFQSAGPGRVQVRLTSRPAVTVTLPVSVSRPDEARLSTESLTFTPDGWDVFQEVQVHGRYKLAGDPPTVHTVVLGPAASTDPRYSGLDAPDVRVTSLELFAFEITPLSGLTTTEGGGVARFNVAVPFQPRADLRIPLSVSDLAEGTVAPQELVFTPRDWDIPRTVQVAGVDDDEVDGPKAFSVIVGPIRTEEPGMDGWELPSVEVTNLDDDVEVDEGGSFYTVEPCRVLDSRNDGGPLAAEQVRVVPIQSRCGIPPGARAVALNVTAVEPTAEGRLSVYPGDLGPTGTSVASFRAGRNQACSAVLGLSGDGAGTLAVRAELPGGGTVHFILDVVGWFD